MEKYIIAIAIVLSTIIYVFANRYDDAVLSTSKEARIYILDRFTGKYYYNKGHNDLIEGTYTPRKLINTEE